jgi:hypothetical protein
MMQSIFTESSNLDAKKMLQRNAAAGCSAAVHCGPGRQKRGVWRMFWQCQAEALSRNCTSVSQSGRGLAIYSNPGSCSDVWLRD